MILINKLFPGRRVQFVSSAFLVCLVCLALAAGCGSGRQATLETSNPDTTPAQPQFKYPFDADRAFADLEKQVAFGPRNPGSEGHRKCRDWIIAESRKTADEVFTQTFRQNVLGQDIEFSNIIAVYGKGKDPGVILAAHWDTRPIAEHELDKSRQNTPIPGANDGASGVAALLELGRMFKQNPPPVRIVMVFFDGEDIGREHEVLLVGSKRFADRFKTEIEPKVGSVKHGILLDMIGYRNIRFPREKYSEEAAPYLNDIIWGNAKAAGLQEYFPNTIGQRIIDDHVPLIEAGIPMVNIISFNYPYWHTLEDTPDKCSPQSLKIVGEVVARTLYESH